MQELRWRPPSGGGEFVSKEAKRTQIQHYLAAPGLSTIPTKLAQRIWDLDFIEMEEFLPSSRTMQLLKAVQGMAATAGAQHQGRHLLAPY